MLRCKHCGGENPDEAIQCYGCGREFDTPKILTVKLTRAGFRIRALARGIDLIVCAGLCEIAILASVNILDLIAKIGFLAPDWRYEQPRFSLAAILCVITARLTYHAVCEGLHGATLGKFVCGLRVVQQDGTPSNFFGSIRRSIAYLWDGIFFGALGYYGSMEKSPYNQRYGDVWGKTIVLKDAEIADEHKRPIHCFILGLVWGIAAYLVFFIFGQFLAARYFV